MAEGKFRDGKAAALGLIVAFFKVKMQGLAVWTALLDQCNNSHSFFFLSC
jgi:hypothetical protein